MRTERNRSHRGRPNTNHQRPLYSIVLLGFALLVMVNEGFLSADVSAEPNDATESVLAEPEVALQGNDLSESSGLAFSRRNVDRVWSHNDSGGQSRLFAFDTDGRKTGQIDLSVPSVDWEDIAIFTDSGVSRLLVADSGDNQAVRQSITLYLFDEPDPDAVTKVEQVQSIEVTYPNGSSDCEAIAVDAAKRQIIMISKTTFTPATVYTVPLPDRVADSNIRSPDQVKSQRIEVTAKELKRLVLPLVTGMDIDSATGDLWVTSYFQAFRFRAEGTERSLVELLDKPPELQALPRWKQIEAIAVDSRSNVWVTSEGVPAKLGRLARPRPADVSKE